jgi:hypothetical protein
MGNERSQEKGDCRADEASAQGACGGDCTDEQRPTGIPEFATNFGCTHRFAESFGWRRSCESREP